MAIVAKAVKAKATIALQELNAALQLLGNGTCQVNLVKSTRKPDAKNTRCLEMTVKLADQFKETAGTNLQSNINGALNGVGGVSAFDHQAFADGRIAALPIDQYPEVKAWFDQIPADDVINPLSGKDNHVQQLKFTHVALTFLPQGKIVRIFRKASVSSMVKKGVMASWIGGTEYDYVDSGSTLVFDMLNDFFVWDDTIFVANYRSLESILNFREITETVASGVCARIFKALPVNEPDKLRSAILKGARQLNRMARLDTKPHIPMLDMKKVASVIAKAKLPLKVAALKGQQTLFVDSNDQDQLAAFMHVLSDDYVKSMMTDLEYVAGDDKVYREGNRLTDAAR